MIIRIFFLIVIMAINSITLSAIATRPVAGAGAEAWVTGYGGFGVPLGLPSRSTPISDADAIKAAKKLEEDVKHALRVAAEEAERARVFLTNPLYSIFFARQKHKVTQTMKPGDAAYDAMTSEVRAGIVSIVITVRARLLSNKATKDAVSADINDLSPEAIAARITGPTFDAFLTEPIVTRNHQLFFVPGNFEDRWARYSDKIATSKKELFRAKHMPGMVYGIFNSPKEKIDELKLLITGITPLMAGLIHKTITESLGLSKKTDQIMQLITNGAPHVDARFKNALQKELALIWLINNILNHTPADEDNSLKFDQAEKYEEAFASLPVEWHIADK